MKNEIKTSNRAHLIKTSTGFEINPARVKKLTPGEKYIDPSTDWKWFAVCYSHGAKWVCLNGDILTNANGEKFKFISKIDPSPGKSGMLVVQDNSGKVLEMLPETLKVRFNYEKEY